MALSNKQTKYLRGLGHRLSPVVTVAEKGLSENVMSEIESALEKHELIKVKMRGDRDQRKNWQAQIAGDCKAELVHSIGHVACFYRRHAEKPVIALPGKA